MPANVKHETFSLPLAISPFLEMGSYELLWDKFKSFSKLSNYLKERLSPEKDMLEKDMLIDPGRISDLVDEVEALDSAKRAKDALRRAGIERFGVRVVNENDFPKRILDASRPPYCLYYQGFWDFLESPCVSVVGTRNPSKEGIRWTKQLVRKLVKDNYTIVSGLAKGIDTVAHETALEAGGATIAVMGTSLKNQYPPENKALREKIAKNFLVLTQFPVFANAQRGFFPERNKVMSAISKATIIVEAGKTSGTRTQARAAIQQKRKLFILNPCFERDGLEWPQRLEKQGAIRVREYQDIQEHLPKKHPSQEQAA